MIILNTTKILKIIVLLNIKNVCQNSVIFFMFTTSFFKWDTNHYVTDVVDHCTFKVKILTITSPMWLTTVHSR